MQNAIVTVLGLDLSLQHNLALIGELDGVAHEVDYDLAESAGIPPHDLRHLRSHLAQKLQSLFGPPQRKRL